MRLPSRCFAERLKAGAARAAQQVLHFVNFGLLPLGHVLSPLIWGWLDAEPRYRGAPEWLGRGFSDAWFTATVQLFLKRLLEACVLKGVAGVPPIIRQQS